MKTYRTGFFLALAGNILLVVILAALWLHFGLRLPHRAAKPAANAPAQSSHGSAQDLMAGSAASSMQSSMPGSAPGSMSTQPVAETPLVPVQISPQRLQSIGVETAEVQRKFVDDEIRTTGNVAVDETRLAYVQTRFSGYVEKVFADATYQYVQKGQPLLTIYSPDLVATEREYLVARQNRQTMGHSTVPGVASNAASLLDATVERLKQWGVSQTEIARLESTGRVQQQLEVDSPVSGYITERNAFPSVAVQPEMRLYTITDFSTVWVQAQVFQDDLARIRIGGAASLSLNTHPNRTFSGRVNFIYPQVDMDTRTAKVRIVFGNPGLQLKPGMFVNVVLQVPMGRQLVIPASGVLQSGARQIVFVNRGDGYLEPRDVQLGARVGDVFIVMKGLKAGEKIVTSANFLIDSESQLQAALGSFVPPPPGAGAASAINAAQASAELTSDPSPPRKGANVFRVKLADANGAPVSGAEVSVTFTMPAMPAMGMAAMRTPVPLSDKGNGVYEGSGQLENGGTWQVSIIARKNGQVIASKQLSVSATGGM
jgi:Cu(I)/Ag(I) efflux system membrane fusion protein/cobalt-zinc-cadmium efflux system membrane fusion protein